MVKQLEVNKIRPEKMIRKVMELHQQDLKKFNKKKFVIVSCPACSSKKFNKTFFKNGFRFVTCKNCQTLFVNPRPTEQMMSDYYKNSREWKYWNKIYKKTEKTRINEIIKPKLKRLKESIKEYNIKNPKTIMEIGSGYGFFCKILKKEKLTNTVIAVEPAPELAKTCNKIKGITVIESTIEEAASKNKNQIKSDIITSFEVIEHVFNPKSFVESCYKILNKGGLLMLSTPNYHGFDLKILKDKSQNVEAPNHLNYFNKDSIDTLLKSIGFKKIKITTPGLLDVSIIMDAMKDNVIDINKNPVMKFLIEQDNIVIEKFQEFITKNNLSSHMWITAIK